MAIALINETDFPAFGFDTELYDSREYFCLSVKASFELVGEGLVLQEEQQPMLLNDEFVGEPIKSGMVLASDIVPYRQRTDVLLSGHAHAPDGGVAERWLAEIKVGSLYKALQITGERQWQHRAIRGWELSDISPASSVRLLYEYAYGGEIVTPPEKPRDSWPWNPVGRGYFGKTRPNKDEIYPGPQILSRTERLPQLPGSRHCETAGFGPIPGHWAPRLKRIGTTDAHWEKNVLPHLPKDFDLRYFNCAPDDQQADGFLKGNEAVAISGLFGKVRTFKLPNYKATALMVDHDNIVLAFPMDLASVHIDLDTAVVSLVWSLTTPSAEWSQASLSVMER
ncbi:DUF2169 family type VI secretion system accessory protein [Diaphorobacter aerolatus]|uniref:DUF2169 domain-containing protein n=1 Tax=Diaphorobacter aerolatus TaxID=1288495 RepID=A0A7H0GGY3_9BURK|nr:DUF2169 domain-containing protein [Diaphorobacter aerolatus]QNP47549.1 DUF2169 domain-containing protein [Diaphorobacter aerolatus]